MVCSMRELQLSEVEHAAYENCQVVQWNDVIPMSKQVRKAPPSLEALRKQDARSSNSTLRTAEPEPAVAFKGILSSGPL